MTELLVFLIAFIAVVVLQVLQKVGEDLDTQISRDTSLIIREYTILEGTTQGLKRAHYNLSWSGANPVHVIAISILLHTDNIGFVSAKALTSDYYGQTKHLLKQKKFLLATLFFLRSMHYSKIACKHISRDMPLEAIDLEVIGAPYFALSTIPVLGIVAKNKAMKLLLTRFGQIDRLNPKDRLHHALTYALTASKLWSMTKDDRYKVCVKYAPLRRDHDTHQLERIARHLRMTPEELFEYCDI